MSSVENLMVTWFSPELAGIIRNIENADRKIIFTGIFSQDKELFCGIRFVNRKRWRPTDQYAIFFVNWETKQYCYLSPRYTNTTQFERVADLFRVSGFTQDSRQISHFVTKLLDEFVEHCCINTPVVELGLKILYNSKDSYDIMLRSLDKLAIFLAVCRISGTNLQLPEGLKKCIVNYANDWES